MVLLRPGLAAGLTTLVPLSGVADNCEAGTAATHAPGAVAMSLPADPVIMALLLISGFQLVKLDAVTDLYDLYDPADDRLFPTPWSEGKQRLDGLFRDVYVQLAVADFWLARQRRARAPDVLVARQRFAQCWVSALEAIETLAGSGSLTPLGMSFVKRTRRFSVTK